MSVTCYKNFSINVAAPMNLTAYWTLNEAPPNVPRLDSVGTEHLDPLGITRAGVPALIGNGVRFAAATGGTGYRSVGGAVIGHTLGQSFSIFGWYRCDGVGAHGLLAPYVAYYMAGGIELMVEVGSSTNPDVVHIATRNNDVYFGAVLGQWYFFHIFHDAILGQSGYSIDAGAEILLPNADVYPTDPTCFVFVTCTNMFPPIDVIFDEVGIKVTDRLTAAQVLYLYNGGAGRTWPIP